MAKYLFVYHGGKTPTNPQEVQEVMNAWGTWFGGLGAAVIDGGNPVGKSYTVRPDGSLVDNGGANAATPGELNGDRSRPLSCGGAPPKWAHPTCSDCSRARSVAL